MNSRRSSESYRPQHSLFFAVMVPAAAIEAITSEFANLRKQYPIRRGGIPSDRLHLSLLRVFAADHLPENIVQTL